MTRGAKPANDTRAQSLDDAHARGYRLDAGQRTRLTTLALALPESAVPERLPAFASLRVDWLRRIQTTAWHDRELIVAISSGLIPVTESDIADMGYRLEFAREVIAGRVVGSEVVAARSADDVASMSDEALQTELRATHLTLCSALVARNAHADESAASLRDRRRAIRSIQSRSGAQALAANSAQVLAFCGGPGVTRWLRALPFGEGAAVDRLRSLDAEWIRRQRDAVDTREAMPANLAQRVWALATAALPGVLASGRFLAKRDASRSASYAAFKAPRARGGRAAKEAPSPAPAPIP